MRQYFLLLLTIILAGSVSAQAVTKNGKITSTGTEYVSKNGAVGSASGVDKNGKEQAASITVAIGDAYQGGIVAYILVANDPGYDPNVQHGLIVTVNDKASSIWSNYTSWFVGTSSSIGSGLNNSTAIVTATSPEANAAKLCLDLVENGYSDWYLPSQGELYYIMTKSAVIGGFTTGSFYWTSNEFSKGAAWSIRPDGGLNYSSKGTSLLVRPVRSF